METQAMVYTQGCSLFTIITNEKNPNNPNVGEWLNNQ